MIPENKFGLMLGLSIAELICCFPITGIVGIILSVLANDAYKKGDYEGYNSSAKGVKIALITGLIISIVIIGILFLFYGSIILAALFSTNSALHDSSSLLPTTTILSVVASCIS